MAIIKKKADRKPGTAPKGPIHTHNPKTGKPHSPAKAKKVKAIQNKGKNAALLLLFLPFTPLAITFLKRKGIKPGKTPSEVITQVYNESQKKSFGLASNAQDVFDYNYAEGEFGLIEDLGYSQSEFGFVPITPAMVTTVITFLKMTFDSIKAKKAKGEKLSVDEQKIADMAPQIERDLAELKEKAAEVDKKAEADAAKEAETPEGGITIGGMHLSVPMLIGILLLIVLVIFMKGK